MDGYCAILTDYEKQEHVPVSASYEDGLITVVFDNDVKITTEVEVYDEYITFRGSSTSASMPAPRLSVRE